MKIKLLLSVTTIALLFFSNRSYSQTTNLGVLSTFEAFTCSGNVTNSGGTVTGDAGTNFGAITGTYIDNTYTDNAITTG